jgi:hypothetical protein
MPKKLNCWEFKNCGRQPGGVNVHDLSICPAAVEKRLDGIHDGNNAGRACWVVAGTMCRGEVQGTFIKKYKHCSHCDFYITVRNEEGRNFVFSVVLLDKLGNSPHVLCHKRR